VCLFGFLVQVLIARVCVRVVCLCICTVAASSSAQKKKSRMQLQRFKNQRKPHFVTQCFKYYQLQATNNKIYSEKTTTTTNAKQLKRKHTQAQTVGIVKAR